MSLSSISDCVRPISSPSLGLRVYPISLPLVVPQPSRFVQMCNVIGDTVLCLLPFLPFSPTFLSLCLHIPTLCPPFLSCFLSLFELCCVVTGEGEAFFFLKRVKLQNCLDPLVRQKDRGIIIFILKINELTLKINKRICLEHILFPEKEKKDIHQFVPPVIVLSIKNVALFTQLPVIFKKTLFKFPTPTPLLSPHL